MTALAKTAAGIFASCTVIGGACGSWWLGAFAGLLIVAGLIYTLGD